MLSFSDYSMHIIWMFHKYFSKFPKHRNDNASLDSFLTNCGGLTNLVDELSRINLIYLKRKITSKQVQLHTVSSTWLRSKVDSRDDFIMQKMSLDLVIFSWKITFINSPILFESLLEYNRCSLTVIIKACYHAFRKTFERKHLMSTVRTEQGYRKF